LGLLAKRIPADPRQRGGAYVSSAPALRKRKLTVHFQQQKTMQGAEEGRPDKKKN